MRTFYSQRQRLLFLVFLLIAGATQPAAAQVWQAATALGTSWGRCVAVDAGGNVYVAGGFTGTVTFGSRTLTATGRTEGFVAKRTAAGGWRWAVRVGSVQSTDSSEIAALTFDETNGGYVTGGYVGRAEFGPVTLLNNVPSGFVAKLDTAGLWLGAAFFSSTSPTGGTSIAADPGGTVRVGGTFTQTATFGPFSLQSAGAADGFVGQLDPSGQWEWVRRIGGPEDDIITSVARDARGATYVAGTFRDSATYATGQIISTGGSDALLARLDSQGSWQWAGAFGSISDDSGASLAVDSAGNSYLTGYFLDSLRLGSSVVVPRNGTYDGYVARFDPAGAGQWVVALGGDDDDDGARIAVDGRGFPYVTGNFRGTATFGPTTLTSAGLTDVFVSALTPTGTWQWTSRAGGTSVDLGVGLAAAHGTVYVAGSFFSPAAAFGAFTLTTPSALLETGYLAQLSASPTGLPAEATASSFTLAPNPAHTTVRLLDFPATATAIELLDPLGRVVRTLSAADQTATPALDVRGLPAGLYLVRVGTTTRRLVIE